MAEEHAPLNKIYVQSFSAGHLAWPVLARAKDPTFPGYVVPVSLSAPPEPAWSATHRFIGSTPTLDDRRVLWTYEILPGPWIPFTRYDDNFGPIQGRRRAVVNTNQAASLETELKTTYEARDGSAIVSWEIEEGWVNAELAFETYRESDLWDDERGPFQRASETIATVGNEVASLTVAAGVATLITYQEIDKYHLKKITETWAVPTTSRAGAERSKEVRGRDVIVTDQQVALPATPDNGSLVIQSVVSAQSSVLGNKRSSTVASLPPNESWAYWDFVGLPFLLFGITHAIYCNGTQFFSLVTNPDSSGGSSVLRKHRVTVGYSATYPNPNLSGSAFTTRDIRYQGKVIGFSYQNALNDALSYDEDASTTSGGSACYWTEAYSFSASTPSATAFASGIWYTRDYNVEQWGTVGFRWTHIEFYSAAGNPSI